MHGITNPGLIKRLNDKIPQSVDEMWKATTAYLIGKTAAANQSKKKHDRPSWKGLEGGAKGAANRMLKEGRSSKVVRGKKESRIGSRY